MLHYSAFSCCWSLYSIHILFSVWTTGHLPGTVCLLLSVAIHRSAELSCGISKGISVGHRHQPFPAHSLIWRVFTDAQREQGAAWQRVIVCFQIISKQQSRHKGVVYFKPWQRSVCTHVERSGTKQLKQRTDKDGPVSLTCTTIIKPSNPQSRDQTVRLCAEIEHHPELHVHTHTQTNGLVWNGNPTLLWVL